MGSGRRRAYIDLGKTVWWAKVQIKPGVVGWVNMNEAKFGGVDALATLAPSRLTMKGSIQPSAVSIQPVADIAENRESKADSTWSG